MAHINPLPGAKVSSEYGNRVIDGKPSFHIGIDLASSEGTDILASDGGTVAYAGLGEHYKYGDWTYGKIIVIAHPNGDVTRYAHCSELLVKVGDKVKQGDVIARVGWTGHVIPADARGSHLHFELYIKGVRANPRDHINFNVGTTTSYPSEGSIMSNKIVCIDPGHGGSDPGAINKQTGRKEKDLTLEIALLVRDKLRANGQPSYVMTRDSDRRLSENLGADLSNRASFSNNAKAHAYVSIHMNAFNGSARGVETYSWNGANTPQLARAIHNRVVTQCPHSVDRGLKTADFAVLRETYAVAALIEMAFIDNTADKNYVTQNKDKYATAIAQGICDYLGVPYKTSSTTPKADTVPSANAEFYTMPIMGKSVLDAKTLSAYSKSINPNPKINCSIEELAQMFIDEGEKEGVRGDIAWCQSLKETGYFKYGGQVLPDQNNYAGIGAVNKSPEGAGAWFETPREGVRAQIQHLKAYASKDALSQQNVDPRFHLVSRGSAPTWVGLSGKWACPGFDDGKYVNLQEAIQFRNDYGSTILAIYHNMLDGYNPPELNKHVAMDNIPDGYAEEAVEWAVENEFMVGDPDGNLRLRDGVTRQEVVAMLYRITNKLKKE